MKTSPEGYDHPVVSDPGSSRFLRFPEGFMLAEPENRLPGPTFPAGFLACGISAGLKESGRPDLGVLTVAPEWRNRAASAAMFTTNAFAAAPVVVDREECDLGGLVGIVVNSGNANACTGTEGLEAARAMQRSLAGALGVDPRSVGVASTGVIGVGLDAARVVAGIEVAVGEIFDDGGAAFGRSIMTTDRFPKACAGSVGTASGTFRVGACCKGAGMISPAMATMLCFVTTDAELTSAQAAALLEDSVSRSFNRVTVDGEMSTNDSIFLLASGASGLKPDDAALTQLGEGLDAVLLRLALMMVADGEGATKIMRLRVVGADSESTAGLCARAVADSPLVKTAMNGCDPNWGRIMSSVGAVLPGWTLPDSRLTLGGVTVVQKGAAVSVSEAERMRMMDEMKGPEVDIEVDLGLGSRSAELFFADMGHAYITVNAEYHS